MSLAVGIIGRFGAFTGFHIRNGHISDFSVGIPLAMKFLQHIAIFIQGCLVLCDRTVKMFGLLVFSRLPIIFRKPFNITDHFTIFIIVGLHDFFADKVALGIKIGRRRS